MSQASTWKGMSPELSRVAERARREPDGQFHSLAHLRDVPALTHAYQRLCADAAVGVDGVTKEQYGQDLEANLQDLHERLRTQRNRHQPIRRVHMPKGDGRTRPLGSGAFEDKVVQDALRELLQAVYEQDFWDGSYGFRPGRSAHNAIRALDRAVDRDEINWVLEADLVSCFDRVDRTALRELLQHRVVDGSVDRLIAKCLHVGVLDGAEFSTPETGTAQGSVLPPLLGNIYLHYVLDSWFVREVQPRWRGRACLIRYADDFVIGCEYREDAERVQAVLPLRLQRYGTLHPDQTRLLDFRRPPAGQQLGKGPAIFDFLGFTLHWRRARSGRWRLGCQTRGARLRRAIASVYAWCRGHRHETVQTQHAALCSRLPGHINYFGVNGNSKSLACLVHQAQHAWYQWLRRRSQRTRLNWQRFQDLLRDWPLPRPRIVVPIWDRPP